MVATEFFATSEARNLLKLRSSTFTGCGNGAGGEPVENLFLTCSQYIAYWDGKYSQTGEDVASGIYLYKLEVDGKVLVKKMIARK